MVMEASEFQLTVPASLMRPYLLLWTKGYNLSTIGEILSHISIYGTVEGCPEIKNDAEREMVESVLPYAPAEQWAEHEHERYGIV